MRLLIVLFSLAVGQLWASPVDKSNKPDFQQLQNLFTTQYLNSHPVKAGSPDGAHPPYLLKKAISLADFMLHNPMPNVFDPDKKRQSKRTNLYVPIPSVEQYIHNHPELVNILTGRRSSKDLAGKRNVFLPPTDLQLFLQSHPNFLTTLGRRSQSDKRTITLTPEQIKMLITNNPSIMAVTGRNAAENLSEKRNIIGNIIDFVHNHPEVLIVRGTGENTDERRAFVAPIVLTIRECIKNNWVNCPLNSTGTRSAENTDARRTFVAPIVLTIRECIKNNWVNCPLKPTGSRSAENFEKRNIIGNLIDYVHNHPEVLIVRKNTDERRAFVAPYVLILEECIKNNWVNCSFKPPGSRSAENNEERRAFVDPSPIYTIHQYLLDHPLLGRRSANNVDKRNIFGTIIDYAKNHPEIFWLSGRSTAKNSDKRDTTVTPDWLSHFVLPGGLYNLI